MDFVTTFEAVWKVFLAILAIVASSKDQKMLKYEDILTYKDCDKATSLLGKRVFYCLYLSKGECGTLIKINKGTTKPYVVDGVNGKMSVGCITIERKEI